MAIKITENGVVRYENEPNVDRLLFPNVEEGISSEQIKQAVDEWLEDHPEATTTVVDGSITKAKLDAELNESIDEIDELKENLTSIENLEYNAIAFEIKTASMYVVYSNGTYSAGAMYSITDFTDISKYKKIAYKRTGTTSSSSAAGIAFYDSSKTYVSGIQTALGQSGNGYVGLYEVTIPENAVYARFTTYSDTSAYGIFELYGISEFTSEINNLIKTSDNTANLIDQTLVVNGYISEFGTINVPIYNEIATDFTEIEGNKDYLLLASYIKGAEVGALQYAFYDENKTFISRGTLTNGFRYSSNKCCYFNEIITTPQNAKHIRISLRYGNTATIWLSNFASNLKTNNQLLMENYWDAIYRQANRLLAIDANVKGICHRGFNYLAPENTIPAFKMAVDNGFRFVETDIRFTSDDVPVLLHDATINRTARNADGSTISSTINIADVTYEQALGYDFNNGMSKYSGIPIPTFEDFIMFCKMTGIHPYIEIKIGTAEQLTSLADIVIDKSMQNNCTWAGAVSALATIKTKIPTARLALIVDVITSDNVNAISGLKTNDNEVVLFSGSSANSNIAKNANVPVEVWTIDDPSGIVNTDNYVSGVVSNYLIASTVLYAEAMT